MLWLYVTAMGSDKIYDCRFNIVAYICIKSSQPVNRCILWGCLLVNFWLINWGMTNSFAVIQMSIALPRRCCAHFYNCNKSTWSNIIVGFQNSLGRCWCNAGTGICIDIRKWGQICAIKYATLENEFLLRKFLLNMHQKCKNSCLTSY